MQLFPEIAPYRQGYLDVPGGHSLYFEEAGNPLGCPVVFLHGGPGAGIGPKHRRYFDPTFWRIVLFDQRGAGLSKPHAGLENNTTWDLVEDIERLRRHLDIASWSVFGGSWGSTLALVYALKHKPRVDSLMLRGIFLGSRREMNWIYQEGASRFFPEAFRDYVAVIPESERHDLLHAFQLRLTHEDPAVRLAAAKAWSGWEGRLAKLLPDPALVRDFEADAMALSIARLENHYGMHRFFLPHDRYLLEQAPTLQGLPCRIVHGRYDMTCPPESAYALHCALPGSEFVVVDDAGHSASDPSLQAALVKMTVDFQTRVPPPAKPPSKSHPFNLPSLTHLLTLIFVLSFALLGTGCSLFELEDKEQNTNPDENSAGALITDSSVVIDEFHFSEALCAEFMPDNFANPPKPDSGEGISLIVTAIACWRAEVVVYDEQDVPVDSFSQIFGIFGQRDGDKERGHVGYLNWKPAERGLNPASGIYLWRIRFDFGSNQRLPLRAWVPWPTR